MTIVVTGGAGFVGASLVRRLVAGGRRVRVLDDLSTGDKSHLEGVDCELVVGDVGDGELLSAVLADASGVVHLAAATGVLPSVDDPVPSLFGNVVVSVGLLEVAVRVGVGRVVLASSGAVLGDASQPVHEDTPARPVSPYAASKLAMEAYASAYAACRGLSVVALRFSNVYGPWSERKTGVVGRFLTALRTGEPLTAYGDGRSARDYVHVSDIAAGLELALEAAVVRPVFQLCSGRSTPLWELIWLCSEVAGVPATVVRAPARPGEVHRSVPSYSLAADQLGYLPAVRLEDGLVDLWRWYEEHVW